MTWRAVRALWPDRVVRYTVADLSRIFDVPARTMHRHAKAASGADLHARVWSVGWYGLLWLRRRGLDRRGWWLGRWDDVEELRWRSLSIDPRVRAGDPDPVGAVVEGWAGQVTRDQVEDAVTLWRTP